MCMIEAYTEDFETKGSLVELQTKYIVGMFSKSANEINWFNRKEIHKNKEDEEVYNFLNKYKN